MPPKVARARSKSASLGRSSRTSSRARSKPSEPTSADKAEVEASSSSVCNSGAVRRAEGLLRELLGAADTCDASDSANHGCSASALGHAVYHARQLGEGAVDPELLARAEGRLAELSAASEQQIVDELRSIDAGPLEGDGCDEVVNESYDVDDALAIAERARVQAQFAEKIVDAVNDGDLQAVRDCLAYVPVDVADADGNTPLSDAACYGEVEIAEFLISQSADVDRQNSLGRTPLWRACYNGHTKAVHLLLENGADKTICNHEGEAPGKYGSEETKALVRGWDTARTEEIRKTRFPAGQSEAHGINAIASTTVGKADSQVLETRLQEAFECIFKCYDIHQDGIVDRSEFLTASEQEAQVLSKPFTGKERQAASDWFSELANCPATDSVVCGLRREQFLLAKRQQLAQISGERPGGEVHVQWVCDLARRLRNMQSPAGAQKPPEWPIKIGIRHLGRAIEEAHKFHRVPLIVCNGLDQPDRYLAYSSEAVIDAMEVIGEVYVHKISTVEQIQDKLKEKLLVAMDTHGRGLSLQIRLGSSACDFDGIFCCPGKFPREVFGGPQTWNAIELRNHFPEPTIVIQPEFQMVVTTAFTRAEAMKHLPAVLPYMEDMALIEIDQASVR